MLGEHTSEHTPKHNIPKKITTQNSDLLPRVATLPLGSGALAGNPFLVDRQFIAQELGFVGGVCPNSMDAVSDRDFVAETIFFCALHLVHLSRWAEDLIIYSSGAFGYVQCSDAYATGSSLMPQKKNPDALELIRGKAGKMQGNLMGVMAVLKGTPTTYNKDFQECWDLMFDAVDSLHDSTRIATGVLSTLKISRERMLRGLSADMLATDLAEYLVRKGVPFRETHHISGAAVKMAEDRGCALSDLAPADLRTIHPLFGDDVAQVRVCFFVCGVLCCVVLVLSCCCGCGLSWPWRRPTSRMQPLACGSQVACMRMQPIPHHHHQHVAPQLTPCSPLFTYASTLRSGTTRAAPTRAIPRAAPASAACSSRSPRCAPTSPTRRDEGRMERACTLGDMNEPL